MVDFRKKGDFRIILAKFGQFGHHFGMARTPKIKVHNTDKGWLVNVPSTFSETGSRQRRFFKTRELAAEFAATLRENVTEHGVKAVTLSSSLTMDALKASDIMAKFEGVTLTQAAQFYAKHHDEAAKCPTMAKAFKDALERRKDLSKAYLRDMKALQKRLPADFMAMNIYEITGKHITDALYQCNGGTTQWRNAFRTLRATLSDQVKSDIIKTNPCDNVHLPHKRKFKEVTIYTPAQVRAVLDACKEHATGSARSCNDCAVPFAVLFFTGIRPVEFTRLTWGDINLDAGFIRLSGEITKTGRTRSIPITDTLRAWLETIPEDEREGKIIPQDWTRKSQRVKKDAGICGREYQDATRHTYGSFTVALEGIDYVRATMGHGHTATFEAHYHNAMTIKQAREYLTIMPPIEDQQKGAKTA